jgi:hypothetical protein
MWSFIAAAVSAAISACALVYVIRTVRHAETQARAAIEGISISSDTARKQLRAYVHVSGARAVYNDVSNERFVVVEIKNYGQTPAHNTKFIMGTVTSAWPVAEVEFQIPPNIPHGMEVLPPGRVSVNVVPLAKLNSFEQNALRDGTGAIYAYGLITYEDIFGEPRRTTFRMACQGDGIIKGQMTATMEGNSAT